MQLASHAGREGLSPPAVADAAGGDGGEAALYPPRAKSGLDPRRREEFIERVAAMRRAYLAQPAATAMSSLQILDIDQIRLRFGRRWPALRPKVLGIVETALQRELGKDDLYVVVSETLVHVFRIGLKRRDAERRGRLLAAEVTERLCGTVPGGVAVRLKTAGFDFNHGLAGIASFEQLRNRVEAFGKALDDHELRLFLDNAGRLEPLFRPTIHFRKGLISAYHLAPLLREPGGGTAAVASLCPTSFNGVFDAETDNWSIQQAATALARYGEAGGGGRRRAPMIVPVHYETLAAMRLREPYLVLCRALPAFSSRHLVLEVLDMPPGLPQSRVRELMAYVKPFCLALVARLPHDAIVADHLQSTGIRGLSLDLGELDPDGPATRDTLHMLVDAARAQRMRCLAVAATAVRCCHLAVKAGVDQLNGDAFMPPTRQAGRVFRAGKG